MQAEFVFTGCGGNFLIFHGCQQHWKILQIKVGGTALKAVFPLILLCKFNK